MPYGTIAADRITGTNGNSISPESSVFRNRIINGAMVIDQRQNGTALTVSPSATGYYGLDRWNLWSFPSGAAGTWTWQRQTSNPPAGFTYYGRATVTTPDTSVAGSDYYTIQQTVEGFNIADFEFGTANAKPFTISFWVRSSVTGTFSCSTYFANANQGYPLTYTINSANTWEYKTINFPALTSASLSGTDKTNGAGIYIIFSLGLGSNYIGTAGVLASGAYGVSGATNLISTNAATFDLTGVQLEVGSQATSFDYREYGAELRMCQRYFIRTNPTGISGAGGLSGAYFSTTDAGFSYNYPVIMRAAPTVTRSSVGGNGDTFWVSNLTATSSGTSNNVNPGTTGMWQQCSAMTSAQIGHPAFYNGSLQLNAEL